MSRCARTILIAAMLGVLAIPARLAAAQATPRYTLIDLGTFGGPNSFISIPSPIVNSQGTVVGFADTSIADPHAPSCLIDCFVSHAFMWQKGMLTDLGSLPGTNISVPDWVSPSGLIAGLSQNGLIDPLTGQPELHAVSWKDGKIQDLGTFGGNFSVANVVNDRGQVVGEANNMIPDSFPSALSAFGPFDFLFGPNGATQNRAFLWQNGHMQDLGTLGGNDANADTINEGGQIAGWSTTNATPNPTTGMPTVDPFFWDQGRMQDLGTLGGTFGYSDGMNNQGEVIGTSDLKGDQEYHPFLWAGGKLTDLGVFGGDFGQTHWINQTGDVAGWATTDPSDATVRGFLWKNGVKIAVGTACGFADEVNAHDQVVGGSCTSNSGGWLWQQGTTYDLNTLIAPSAVHVNEAFAINDRSEIVAYGVLPNGNQHMVLLVPTDLAQREGLTTATQSHPAAVTGKSISTMHRGLALRERVTSFRVQQRQRHHHRVR